MDYIVDNNKNLIDLYPDVLNQMMGINQVQQGWLKMDSVGVQFDSMAYSNKNHSFVAYSSSTKKLYQSANHLSFSEHTYQKSEISGVFYWNDKFIIYGNGNIYSAPYNYDDWALEGSYTVPTIEGEILKNHTMYSCNDLIILHSSHLVTTPAARLVYETKVSKDAKVWSTSSKSFSSIYWTGKKYLGVLYHENYSPNSIGVSTDGINWSSVHTEEGKALSGLGYNGKKYMTWFEENNVPYVLFSTDGEDWGDKTECNTDASASLSINGYLISNSDVAARNIRMSIDGINWYGVKIGESLQAFISSSSILIIPAGNTLISCDKNGEIYRCVVPTTLDI